MSISNIISSRQYNRRSTSIVTQPTSEPVTIADVKLSLRITDSTDDAMLTRMVRAAREAVEGYLNRSIITQTRKLTLDAFPNVASPISGSDDDAPSRSLGMGAINLPMGPVQSISSLKYYDESNTLQTIAGSLYTADAAGARLLLNSGQSWPTSPRSTAAVEVTYICGYGADATAVPAAILEGIIQVACRMYESRGCCAADEAVDGCRSILAPYRLTSSFGRTW